MAGPGERDSRARGGQGVTRGRFPEDFQAERQEGPWDPQPHGQPHLCSH